MKMKRFRALFLMVFLLILTALACGPSGSSGGSSIPSAKELLESLRPKIIEASRVYTQMTTAEIQLSRAHQRWQEGYSNMLAGASDQYHIMEACYTNTAEAAEQAAFGVFGVDAEDNPLSDEAETEAFVSALVSGEGLYVDVAECQEAARDFMTYVRVERVKVQHLREDVLERIAAYETIYTTELDRKIALDFLAVYGNEFGRIWEEAEGELLEMVAAEGLDPLPKDFIGFPTAALTAKSNSQAICQGYQDIYLSGNSSETPDGSPAVFWRANWDNVIKQCTLTRKAALAVIGRLFVTQQASDRFDCGRDAGLFEEVQCDQ